MNNQLITDIERLLREISVIVKQREREILNYFPVTRPQFTVLLLLDQYGEMTIGELSQKCCLACSTMTDLIDRMEKKQVVERIRDKRDRRVVHIYLLEKGQELITEVMKAREQYLTKILSEIPQEDVLSIKKHLSMVYESMKESRM